MVDRSAETQRLRELEKALRRSEKQLERAEAMAAAEQATQAALRRPRGERKPAPPSALPASKGVQGLSSNAVRAHALAELEAGDVQALANRGKPRGSVPSSKQPPPPHAAPPPTKRLPPVPSMLPPSMPPPCPQRPARGGSAAPLGESRPPPVAARRAQSAGGEGLLGLGAISSIVSGLDSLKDSMQTRRQSAAATSKALGPTGTRTGVARGSGVSLRWHGTRSFLDSTRSNR